jgi:hypothetical protein
VALVVANPAPRHRREHPWHTAIALLVAVTAMSVVASGAVVAVYRSLDSVAKSVDEGLRGLGDSVTVQAVGTQVPVTTGVSLPVAEGSSFQVVATGLPPGRVVVAGLCPSSMIERPSGCGLIGLGAGSFATATVDATGAVRVTLTASRGLDPDPCRVASSCVVVVGTSVSESRPGRAGGAAPPRYWGVAPFQTAE